jgi:hypothetical protein
MTVKTTTTYKTTDRNKAKINASVLQAQHRQGPMRRFSLRSSSVRSIFFAVRHTVGPLLWLIKI